MKVKLNLMKNMLVFFGVMLIAAGCGGNAEEVSGNTENDEEINEEEGQVQYGGEAVFAYSTDASNLDPIFGNSGADHALLWPIYETLIKFTPQLEPEPGLAESWDIPDDNTLVLNLREGLVFHDGTPLDAEAVKYNIERINSEDSRISDLQNIESVDVVDELTVQLNLSAPDSSLLLALSDRGGMMVSPTAVEENDGDVSQNPVGAGPFKMVNHVLNGEIEYEAFDEYWKEGEPYLDKMTVKFMPDENTRINALESGEVDYAFYISAANVDTLENNPEFVLEQITPVEFFLMYFNTDLEPLDNENVRKAIIHGVDREAFVEAITFGTGEPAHQPFPADYWASDNDLTIEYDPEKSRQLLEESGLENVSLTMSNYANAYEQRMADVLKSQLEEIGIEVNLETMELNAANTQYFNEGKIPSLMTRWTGRPDPLMTLNYLFAGDTLFNVGGHTTEEIENLLLEARSSYDQDERTALFSEISEKAILEEGIMLPLFFDLRTDAMHQSLKGFEPNLLGKPIFSTTWKEQ